MNRFKLAVSYDCFYSQFSDKLRQRIASEYKLFIQDYLFIFNDRIFILEGFKWDGCTPKYKLLNKYWIGTPDGRVDKKTGKRKMYYPSLVHDILYINLEKIPFSRKTVDLMFYELAKAHDFKFAFLYYFFVRLFGGVYHCVTK